MTVADVDRRVPGFLGRVLNGAGTAAGTCFQVDPRGIIATAWHVLNELGAGEVDAQVSVDPLQGGAVRTATVVAADPLHDLAVLRLSLPLPGSVAGLWATDDITQRTALTVTGVAAVEDAHTYRFLNAPGKWAGGTTRDEQIPLGRLTAPAVQKGMSGAPVLTDDDHVVGVVSARYNSVDGWLRDTVWVARTENLPPLLFEVTAARVMSRPRPVPSEMASRTEAELIRNAIQRHWDQNPDLQGAADSASLSTAWRTLEPPLSDHWFNVRRGTGRESLDLDGDITQIYDLVTARVDSGRLVIIGPPGSGKSTLLQRFTSDWIATRKRLGPTRVGNALDARVPVILQLNDWDPAGETLADFVRSQLIQKYRLRDETKSGETTQTSVLEFVLPMLDGLDEMAPSRRELAVEQLNADRNLQVPFVLTCRSDEFRRIASWSVVRGAAAVEIDPLGVDGVLDYLRQETPPVRQSAWNEVEDRVREFPRGALAEAMTTPLLVNVMREVYARRRFSPRELLEGDEIGEITAPLINRFVPALYDPDSTERTPWLRRYRPRRATRHAIFLSGNMVGRRSFEIAWWDLTTAVPRLFLRLPFAVLTAIVVYQIGRFYSGPLSAAFWAVAVSLLLAYVEAHDYLPKRYRLTVRRRPPDRITARRAILFAVATAIVAVNWWRRYGMTGFYVIAMLLLIVGAATVYFFQISWNTEARVADSSLDSGRSLRTEILRSASRALVPPSIALAWWLAAVGVLALGVPNANLDPVTMTFLQPANLAPVAVLASLAVLTATAAGGHLIARGILFATGRMPLGQITFLEDAAKKGLLRRNGSRYQIHSVFRDALATNVVATETDPFGKSSAKSLAAARSVQRSATPDREITSRYQLAFEQSSSLFKAMVLVLSRSPDFAMPIEILRPVASRISGGLDSRWRQRWEWHWQVYRRVRKGNALVRLVNVPGQPRELVLKSADVAEYGSDATAACGSPEAVVWDVIKAKYGRRISVPIPLPFFVQFLIACSRPAWSRSPEHVRNFGCHYAARAGELDSLLTDYAYLAHATPHYLMPYLANAAGSEAREARDIYIGATARRQVVDPSSRRQLLDTYALLRGFRLDFGDYIRGIPVAVVAGNHVDSAKADVTHSAYVQTGVRSVLLGRSDGTVVNGRVSDGAQAQPLPVPNGLELLLLEYMGGGFNRGSVAAIGNYRSGGAYFCSLDLSGVRGNSEVVDFVRLTDVPLTRGSVAVLRLDGSTFAAVAIPGESRAMILDASDGQCLGSVEIDQEVRHLAALTCDGRPTLAVGSGSFVRLFDLGEIVSKRSVFGLSGVEFAQSLERQMSGERSVRGSGTFQAKPGTPTRARSYCVTANSIGRLTCWDLLSGGPVGNRVDFGRDISAVAVMVRDRRTIILLGDSSGAVLRWTPTDGQYRKVFHVPGRIDTLTVAGRNLIVHFDGNIVEVGSSM